MARLALGISIPPAGYMLASLPWPPRGAELGSFVVLALGLVLSGAALLAGARRPRRVVGALALPAAYGGFMLVRFGRHLVSAATEWGRMGPAATIGYVLAASVAMAWIAALWHSRPLWPAASSVRDRTA